MADPTLFNWRLEKGKCEKDRIEAYFQPLELSDSDRRAEKPKKPKSRITSHLCVRASLHVILLPITVPSLGKLYDISKILTLFRACLDFLFSFESLLTSSILHYYL